MGHFTGQRAWMSIEDIVNKQSGVLVGEYCNEFNSPTWTPQGVYVQLIMYVSIMYIYGLQCNSVIYHVTFC